MLFNSPALFTRNGLRLTLAGLLALAQVPAFAQQTTTPAAQPSPPPQQQQQQQDEVLRVSTNLVQTDVSVVDKKGQFVEGLQRDQFELQVEGKPQQVLFFERITAGGANEAGRIAAARGETPTTENVSNAPRVSGRTVIFFIDDLHLSPEGLSRAKELLRNFAEKEMTPDMQVLLASPGGQIGFLQQFTNDRAVVRAAAGRLKYLSQASLDYERPQMSAYQAELIDRGDRDMLAYMVAQTLSETVQASRSNSGAGQRESLMAIQVQQRARRIRRQAAQMTAGVITSLESVVRVHSPLGGRQTLFFISEGFNRDTIESDLNNRMQRVTEAAARTGTVVYTLYARGLAVGMIDASSSARADIMVESESGTRGFAAYSPVAELSAKQEILRDLAAETGGRALINTNALEAAVSKTLNETSNYYLLAWRPEGIDITGSAPKFRKLEIKIKGRPDLTVRVRRGYSNSAPATQLATGAATTAATPATTTTTNTNTTALNGALNSLNPRREVPIAAYAVFTSDAQGGSVINASVQLTNDRLQFTPAAGGKQQAQVEVVYVLFDDKGKVVRSDGRTLTVGGNETNEKAARGGSRGKLVTSFSIPVTAPGIYQFRTAARDANSGLVGSDFEWIEVPDIKAKKLALSSLLITERRRPTSAAVPANGGGAATAAAATANQPPDVLRVERRFARSSRIFLQLYIYNAARAAANASADVEMEIKILSTAGRAVMNAPSHKVLPADDPARIFYAAEVPLAGMPPGVYLLQVTATDRLKRSTATRELNFTVE